MTQLEGVEITSLLLFYVSWKFSRGNSPWGNELHTKSYFRVGNSHLPTDGYKNAPIVIKTSLPLCISFVSASPRHVLFQTLLLNFIADIFNKFCCESNKI